MATYVLEVPLAENGQSVYVEVDPSEVGAGIDLVSDEAGRAVARVSRTLQESLDPVRAFVSAAIEKLRQTTVAPDEVQVEFSLKLGGETGFIFAKGTAESVLKMTATWKNSSGG